MPSPFKPSSFREAPSSGESGRVSSLPHPTKSLQLVQEAENCDGSLLPFDEGRKRPKAAFGRQN